MRALALVAPFVLPFAIFACSSDKPADVPVEDAAADTDPGDTAADAPVDTAPPPDVCATAKLEKRPFDGGKSGVLRHDLAGDFTVTHVDGSTWQFSKEWSGCESYVFVPDSLKRSAKDSTSIWARDLDKLVATSPLNVHYFFLSRTAPDAAADASTAAMAERVTALLATLPEDKAAHWSKRLHVIKGRPSKWGNWLDTVAGTGIGNQGFAIDRFQRIRGVGNLADVTRYKSALADASVWPWETNLAYAAYEARLYEFEVAREAALAKDKATVVDVYTGETLQQFAEKEVTLPSATEMAKFDTLVVDIDSRCPDPNKVEFGNCGAWDYIAALSVYDGAGKAWEIARFITTYHRESRWVVDISPMLALLQDGGKKKLRWEFAPEWNKQPTATRLSLRLSNQGKGMRPTKATYLWNGGAFSSKYDELHPPQDVPIPATAKKVELFALVTGHGADAESCAEFCNHQHEITVGGTAFFKEFTAPDVAKNNGCIAETDKGMPPNQGGTWWFGRGGWCPGQLVAPWREDVTKNAKAGETAKVSYKGLFKKATPPDGAGNIQLSSWLVVWE